MDSNTNLVWLDRCLYQKENQQGYERLQTPTHPSVVDIRYVRVEEVKMEGYYIRASLGNTEPDIITDSHTGTVFINVISVAYRLHDQ